MGANAGKDQIPADSVRAPLPQRPVPLQCHTRKKCFRTEEDAQPYIRSLTAQEHPARSKRLAVYKCGMCRWLHVGHDFGHASQRTARRGKHRKMS